MSGPVIRWRARWRNLHAALLTFATGRHHYVSTACLHGDHRYCAGHAGLSGAKTPAACKFCNSGCRCPDHRAGKE